MRQLLTVQSNIFTRFSILILLTLFCSMQFAQAQGQCALPNTNLVLWWQGESVDSSSHLSPDIWGTNPLRGCLKGHSRVQSSYHQAYHRGINHRFRGFA